MESTYLASANNSKEISIVNLNRSRTVVLGALSFRMKERQRLFQLKFHIKNSTTNGTTP